MKKVSKMFSIALGLLILTLPSWATIRHVSATGGGTYTSVLSAYNASAAGDTILIGPGTYAETADITVARRLIFIGAGWDQTTVNMGANLWQFNNAASSFSSVEGIRLIGANNFGAMYCAAGTDSISFRRCLIRANTQGQIINLSATSGRIYIEDCILIAANHNSYNGVEAPNNFLLLRNCVIAGMNTNSSSYAVTNGASNNTQLDIENCVFLNWGRIVFKLTTALPDIHINNVYYDWKASPSYGTFPPSSIYDYVSSDNTGPASFPAGATNTIALAANNPFVNYNTTNNYEEGISNLHLNGGTGGLLLTNTGHPSLLDIDASRSDLGIYGGPRPLIDGGVPNYPWATFVNLTPNLVGQGTNVNATSIGRVGPQY